MPRQYTHISYEYDPPRKFRIVDTQFKSNNGSYLLVIAPAKLNNSEYAMAVDEDIIQTAVPIPEWDDWPENAVLKAVDAQGIQTFMHFAKSRSTVKSLRVWALGRTSHTTDITTQLTPDLVKSVLENGYAPF